jgi:cobalt-zinc-cadmium efflux system protein
MGHERASPPHGHSHPHAHGHAHAHAHAHRHAHRHATDRAFAAGIALNLAIVVLEGVYGVAAHSMALLADAGHNLGDVLGLVLAGGAMFLARRRGTKRRTYGYRRLTMLAALANGILLLVAVGAIASESIRRLGAPREIAERPVIAVAALAIVVNGASALAFAGGTKRDLNVRAAFLHLASDAGISAAVVAGALVTLRTGWLWLDPALSLAVAAAILASTWSLLRRALDLVLDAVPEGIDIDAVRVYLAALPNVRGVHDLHVWPLSTTETALTAHLVMPNNTCEPTFLSNVCDELRARFEIDHATLQVDPEEAPNECRLAPEGCEPRR